MTVRTHSAALVLGDAVQLGPGSPNAACAVRILTVSLSRRLCMGCGASTSQGAATATSNTATPPSKTMASVDHLNILLQEDLTIRGYAFLPSCGIAAAAAAAQMTACGLTQ